MSLDWHFEVTEYCRSVDGASASASNADSFYSAREYC